MHITFDNCIVKDETGHVSQFNIHGNPQCIKGIKGDAFYFDGDDWIGANTFYPIANGTIIVFVKPDEIPESENTQWYILSSKVNFAADVKLYWNQNTSKPQFKIGHTDTIYYSDFKNRWIMLAYTYKNGTSYNGEIYGYLNGNLIEKKNWKVNEYTISWYGDKNAENLDIGMSFWHKDFLKNAAIDEIIFYNRPLSPSEIKQIYHEITGG